MHAFCTIIAFLENTLSNFLEALANVLKRLVELSLQAHESKRIKNYPKNTLEFYNTCFLHVVI